MTREKPCFIICFQTNHNKVIISTSVPPSHTLPHFIMGEIDLWSSYAAGDETGISAHPLHLFVVG